MEFIVYFIEYAQCGEWVPPPQDDQLEDLDDTPAEGMPDTGVWQWPVQTIEQAEFFIGKHW